MAKYPLQELNISNLNVNDPKIKIPIHVTNKSNSKFEQSLFLPTTYSQNVSISNLFNNIEQFVTDTLELHKSQNVKILHEKSFLNNKANKANNDKSIIKYKKGDIIRKGVYVEIADNDINIDKNEQNQQNDLLQTRLKQLCVSRNGDRAYEYFDDIMKCFKEREEEYFSFVDSNYMENVQTVLTWRMRKILIDWFYDLQRDLGLNDETLFAAIHFVDIFLTATDLEKRSLLQLLGVSCILTASKTYEIIPQQIDELIYLSNDQYSRKQVIDFEKILLMKINWNAFQITPCNFISPWLHILNIQQKSKEKLLIDLLIYAVALDKYYFQIRLSKLIISFLYLTMFIYLEYNDNDVYKKRKDTFQIICTKLFSFNPFKCNDKIKEGFNIIQRVHKILVDVIKKGESTNISAVYRRFTDTKYLKRKYGSSAARIDIKKFEFDSKFKKYMK